MVAPRPEHDLQCQPALADAADPGKQHPGKAPRGIVEEREELRFLGVAALELDGAKPIGKAVAVTVFATHVHELLAGEERLVRNGSGIVAGTNGRIEQPGLGRHENRIARVFRRDDGAVVVAVEDDVVGWMTDPPGRRPVDDAGSARNDKSNGNYQIRSAVFFITEQRLQHGRAGREVQNFLAHGPT